MSLIKNEISTGYSIQLETLSRTEWDKIVCMFDDATLYQTYSYGDVRWGSGSLSHLLLRKGNDVVAACQARMISVPLLGQRIAYVSWGPMWRRKNRQPDVEDFRQVLRALRIEYANKRQLYLRIMPNEISGNRPELLDILKEEDYRLQTNSQSYRTFLVDIQPELEDIRMNTLHKKWREKLNRSMRNDLEIQVGSSDEMYAVFEKLYAQMHSRKGFVCFVNIEEFKAMQKTLPDALKLKLGLCYHDGEAITGLIWSDIGEKGISILSATGHKGLKLRGSYLLRWKMFEQLKQIGAEYSDQGGLDPVNNPGGYEFRLGLGGSDIHHIGQYDFCAQSLWSVVFQVLDFVRAKTKIIKLWFNRLLKKGAHG